MALFFLYSPQNPNPVFQYLATWGRVHRRHILPLTYDSLFRKTIHAAGVYLFADLELLSTAERRRAAEIWQELHARGLKLLNHPEKSLRRYDLLQSLAREGLNPFQVYTLEEDYTRARLPVFVRHANDHRGPQSELITTPAALSGTVERLRNEGADLREWLVTEFTDTADAHGIYRKYAAFNVDGRILPNHLYCSRNWCTKRKDMLTDAAFIAEETDYLAHNPHREQLARIFALARIDYGRIDYNVADGRICAWEINTNPMIITLADMRDRLREDINRRFDASFSTALTGLSETGTDGWPAAYWPDRIDAARQTAGQRFRLTAAGRLYRRLCWKWNALMGK